MPDLESLILAALINFLLKHTAKMFERAAVNLFKKFKGVLKRD